MDNLQKELCQAYFYRKKYIQKSFFKKIRTYLPQMFGHVTGNIFFVCLMHLSPSHKGIVRDWQGNTQLYTSPNEIVELATCKKGNQKGQSFDLHVRYR